MQTKTQTRRNRVELVGTMVAFVLMPCCLLAGENSKKVNIVLFVSDDHGYNDSGVYGDSDVRTPNIDRLAGESMRFTHAFAASPLCSPSRCVIGTGRMPHRNGGHKFGTPIRNDIPTMPEYFKKLGYYTAHIGKFHHSPRKRFPYEFVHKNENTAPEFIAKYDQKKPLFLVVCSHPPHTPWIKNTTYDSSKFKLPPNFIDTPETRQDRSNYYSDVTLMDSILGNVLRALQQRGLNKNTLFVYTSDQGANWPFAKWCVYDSGLRVPLLVRYPNKVTPGSLSDAMINLADLLPTFIEAAGGKPPKDIDGRSFLSVLIGKAQEHRSVVFGTHTGNDNGGPGIANHCPARTIRSATHRYVFNLAPETTFTTHITGCKTGAHYLPHWDSWLEEARTNEKAARIVQAYQHRPREELFDITNDPHEMNNLADNAKYAHEKSLLRQQLAKWCSQQGDTVAVEALLKLGATASE